MLLLTHIIIAISSLFVTTYAYMVPTQQVLRLSYVFVALTIASGTLLTVLYPAYAIRACVSGLVYTAVVMAGIAAVRRKLSTANN